MSEREFERWLSDLGPVDLERDLASELERIGRDVPQARKRLDEHLRYLQLISARQVRVPGEPYFAQARSRILSRVEIRPVSLGAQIRALLLPEGVRLSVRKAAAALTPTRPLPGVATLALVTMVLMTGIFLFQPGERPSPVSGLERYLSLQERFSAEPAPVRYEGSVLDGIDVGQIDILLRSAAILSSPSSLSRSWTSSFRRK
jgi:hypothetical protein